MGTESQDDELAAWCRTRLGSEPVRRFFHTRQLSEVAGVELADGRRVAIKTRPAHDRLHGCAAVQRVLHAAGFPCPEPLAGPVTLDGMMRSAEAWVAGDERFIDRRRAPERFAQELARLVALVPDPAAVPSLDPPPAWVWWDHDEPGVWPIPDAGPPLDGHPASGWLDEIGARVRERLARVAAPPVIGHADWESQNLRWAGERLHVVHDWDSAICQPEALIAGAAAAVFPVSGGLMHAASLEETTAFLAAYERARGRPFDADEREAAWAAGLWVRAFNAKKTAVAGREPELVATFRDEAAARLRLAGAAHR